VTAGSTQPGAGHARAGPGHAGGPGGAQTLAEIELAAASQPVDTFGQGCVIVCKHLVRIYLVEGVEVQALQGLDLEVAPGELTALIGASGSGKSTLLNILSGMDRPTAGQVTVAGHDLLTMKGKDRLQYRRETVGFIWQQTSRNLLPYLTAAENVAVPMGFTGVNRRARAARAASLLELLGVAGCRDRLPAEMSGGEQQCAAIAVALANDPKVVLADEPTGELDTATAAHVFGALRTASAEAGVTVLVVTHDAEVAEHVARTLAIRDGRTSTEVLRRATAGGLVDAGSSEEYAVLDRSGRLQLPDEFTEALALRDRVRLALEPDHIGVWPDTVPPAHDAERPGRHRQALPNPAGTRPASARPAGTGPAGADRDGPGDRDWQEGA